MRNRFGRVYEWNDLTREQRLAVVARAKEDWETFDASIIVGDDDRGEPVDNFEEYVPFRLDAVDVLGDLRLMLCPQYSGPVPRDETARARWRKEVSAACGKFTVIMHPVRVAVCGAPLWDGDE